MSVHHQLKNRLSAAWFAAPRLWPVAAVLLVQLGCGTIREQRATDQLLLSDAVDRSVAHIDFSPLAYEKVYFDSRYLQFKNDSAVTTNYVISSLRQQMVVAGCLLQDRIEDADYVVEARVGTMGADGHEINYGVPASNPVNAAASVVGQVPPLPSLPEISLGRRTEDMAAVKIAAFAYGRESRLPVWQSGTSLARSDALSTWVLGAGPFKRGSIYRHDPLGRAGTPIRNPFKRDDELGAQDYAYRDTKIWAAELRDKVASGKHLSPPRDEQVAAEAQPAAPAENGVEIADRTNENVPQ